MSVSYDLLSVSFIVHCLHLLFTFFLYLSSSFFQHTFSININILTIETIFVIFLSSIYVVSSTINIRELCTSSVVS